MTMRKSQRVLLALAALAVPSALAAQAVPGEVELHIEATARAEPDRAVTSFALTGSGDTRAAARAQLADQHKILIAELGKLGIAPGNLTRIETSEHKVSPPVIMVSAVSPPQRSAAAGASKQVTKAPAVVPPPPPPPLPPRIAESSNANYRLEVADIKQLPEIEAALGRLGMYYGRMKTTFLTGDPDKARARARTEALAKARAEAEGYAAALGYKLVRLVRVSNVRPALNTYDLFSAFEGKESRRSQLELMSASAVETVVLDYVIAPK